MGLFTLFSWMDVAVARNDDIVAVLLICLVVSIGVSALVVRGIVRSELRRKRTAPARSLPRISAAALIEAPTRWLAIRAESISFVQAALGLQNPRICAWTDALVTPFEPRLFISPPVRGWILVMGADLPDPSDDVDECFMFLTQLSQKVGDVQFFVRNRAVSHHGWAKIEGGKVIRAYVWAGETVWNQGTLSNTERDLKLRCLSYTESPDVLGLSEREVLTLNTEKVIRLAGEWSVDPTTVEADALDAKGIAGDLLHSKLH